MNCRRALRALPEILDGGGSDALRAAVERHLAACPACRREREALQRSWDLLDAVQAPPADARFTAAVLSRVEAEESGAASRSRGPTVRSRSWWLAPAGATALVALLVVSALVTQTHRPPVPMPAVVEPVRTLTDEDIIRDLDVYEQLDLLDNLLLLADLEVLEDSEVEL